MTSSPPDSSPSPPRVESLVAGRSRRSNAGNRLQVLLAAQEPLEDEDNIFIELEDDQEYDLEQEQEVESAEDEDDDQDQGRHTDDEEISSRRTKISPKRKRPIEEREEDEENFSSSSEDSTESGHEGDDFAGEKELQRQEKEAKRKRKRQAELPFLKKPPPSKKKRVTISDAPTTSHHQPLRHSNRAATVRNKEDVTQRLKESEARRAKIVPVAPKPKIHMTQEQRLAEAIITEEKNKQSLVEFFEQESDRKKKQRATILAKRPTLTYFIRFRSVLDRQPKFVQELEEPVSNVAPVTITETATGRSQVLDSNKPSESPGPASHTPTLEATSEPTPPINSNPKKLSSVEQDSSAATDASKQQEEEMNIKKSSETVADNASPLKKEAEEVETGGQIPEKTELAQTTSTETPTHGQEHTEESAKNDSNADMTKLQPATDSDEKVQVSEIETKHDTRELETVARTLVSLEEFPPEAIQKPNSLKEILLGPNALKPARLEPRPSLCLITGKPSRFRDPFSGISYYGLREYKMIRALYNRTLGPTTTEQDNGEGCGDWDIDVLHGAYYYSPEDLLQSGPKLHAKGVPDEFCR